MQLKVLLLAAILAIQTSCGSQSQSKFNDLPKEPFIDVPLPLFACKQVFRRSFTASGLDKIYGELLSVPPLKGTGDRTLIEAEFKSVSEGHSGHFQSIANFKIAWSKALTAEADGGSGFEHSVACAKSIQAFLKTIEASSWPAKKFETEFYKTFGKYFEPTRQTGYTSNVFSGVELSGISNNLGETKEIELDAFDRISGNNILNWNSTYFFGQWAIGTALLNDPKLKDAEPEAIALLQKAISDGQAFYDEARILTSQIGFFGHWQKEDGFELAWNSTLSAILVEMNACNMKFFGAKPLSVGDGITSTCSKDINSRYAKVNAIGVALHLMEIAGLAKDDGDEQNALALLEITKEVLKVAVDIGLGFSPMGRAKDIVEAVSGYSIIPPDFDQLSTAERVMCVAGAITVGSGTVGILAKYLGRSEIASVLFKTAVKADAVFKAAMQEISELADLSSLKRLTAEKAMENLPAGHQPYYKAKSTVVDFTTNRPTKWVRLHGESNKVGDWLAREADVVGLSPKELKAKFSLPDEPTHISDVYLPDKYDLRMGVVAKNFGGNEGAIQFKTKERAKTEFFKNTRALK